MRVSGTYTAYTPVVVVCTRVCRYVCAPPILSSETSVSSATAAAVAFSTSRLPSVSWWKHAMGQTTTKGRVGQGRERDYLVGTLR